MEKSFNEQTVLKILALGLDTKTQDHYLRYLLGKLYGKDGLSLDGPNTEFLKRIEKIAEVVAK